MYRILIVEDDSTIASNVAAHLERWDYETKQIEDFKCVMEVFQQFDPAACYFRYWFAVL